MDNHFLDLRATHNSHRWYLPVTSEVTVGPAGKEFLFGGAGMSAAVRAMEATCRRPVIWATAQYLSFAREGAIVDFDVREVTVGNTISQVRVAAHIGDQEILTVNAALGRREGPSDQWRKAPDVPPPEDCAPSATGGAARRAYIPGSKPEWLPVVIRPRALRAGGAKTAV